MNIGRSNGEFTRSLLAKVEFLDKTNTRLIKTLINQQRENRVYKKIIKRMYIMMNQGQKNIVDVWLKEVMPDDPT